MAPTVGPWYGCWCRTDHQRMPKPIGKTNAPNALRTIELSSRPTTAFFLVSVRIAAASRGSRASSLIGADSVSCYSFMALLHVLCVAKLSYFARQSQERGPFGFRTRRSGLLRRNLDAQAL